MTAEWTRVRIVRIASATTMSLAIALGLAVLGGPVAATSPTTRSVDDDAGSGPMPWPQLGGTTVDSDGDQLTDVFETRWGITDPFAEDSDGDGLLDPAEDPDGDRLGNLAEQRYGTSPSSADTDGDGIRDGAEDRDHDGVSDAREQDARPVPKHLRPSLGHARSDLPANYSNGCHSGPYGAAIHPCVLGDPSGSVRITLFGDSHALQWLPALERLAKPRHWRIVAITKSACPSVDVSFREPYFPGALRSCRIWRDRGERWIRTHRQDLVIIANSRGYRLIDAHGELIPKARGQGSWRRGLGRTLRAMPSGSKLLVLGDTPLPGIDVPACLRAHPTRIDACERSRQRSTGSGHDTAERAAAEANGATFSSLSRTICSYDPCPVVVSGLLIWRDRSHLTATYARQLAPSLWSIIVAVLDPTGVLEDEPTTTAAATGDPFGTLTIDAAS